MKIFSYQKALGEKLTNLGAKIKMEKLNSILNGGDVIILRKIVGSHQEDFRIKKVYMDPKKRKFHYALSFEIGKPGFDEYSPRQYKVKEDHKFSNINELMTYIVKNLEIVKEDWIIG